MALRAASSLTFPPRIIVSIEGEPKTGKTTLALTLPRPTKVFNTDFGLEGLLGTTPDKISPKGIAVADYALTKAASLVSSDAVQRAREVFGEFNEDYHNGFLRKTERRLSGVIDTGTELWELFRLGDLEALERVPQIAYTRVNRIFRGVMNGVFETPHSLAIIHRLEGEYRDGVNPKTGKKMSEATGRRVYKGFKEMDGIAQVVVRTWKRPREGRLPMFGFDVRCCRARVALEGRRFRGAMATLPILALAVSPDVEPSAWGMEEVPMGLDPTTRFPRTKVKGQWVEAWGDRSTWPMNV